MTGGIIWELDTGHFIGTYIPGRRRTWTLLALLGLNEIFPPTYLPTYPLYHRLLSLCSTPDHKVYHR